MPAQNLNCDPCCALPWRALQFAGADADAFLNGQLTARVPAPESTACQLAGYCLPNGRLLALLWLWRADGVLHAALPADAVEPALQRLRLFVLRSDVQITVADDTVVGWFNDSNRDDTPGASGLRVALAANSNATADPTDWVRACINAGIASIRAATQDQVIPQMIGLEQLGGLDFRKGCYPGQEIIARLHYKGTLKQRMFRARVEGALPAVGSAVVNGDASSGVVLGALPDAALVLARADDAGQMLRSSDGKTALQLEAEAVFPTAR